jgi:photosystem II stability/assembly factor-like uncharacterized protein
MKTRIINNNSLTRFSFLQKYLLYVFCFINIAVRLNAQDWQWQNPLPQGNTLYSVQYVNNNIIWASGAAGTLIKSKDGGETWEVVLLPERIYAEDVFFISKNVGWTCGQLTNARNLVFGTKDGGNNWELQLDIVSFNLVTISFANEREGWVAGEAARIYHTTDGGENWDLQVNLPGDVHSIFVLDSLHTWLANTSANGGAIYYTKNGGNTWLSDSSISWSYDIHFIDTLNGWAVGRDKIARTTDGGTSWEIQLDNFLLEWTDIYMVDKRHGWAITSFETKIAVTNNGGDDWIIQDNPAEFDLESIVFKDSSNGFAVGLRGTIIKTNDGGQNWTDIIQRITSSWLSDVYFINDSIGWVVGDSGLILNTKNGGSLWSLKDSGILTSLSNTYFIDSLIGWAVGDQGTILMTSDGGNNWTIEASPSSLPIQDIEFTNYPTGWIIGGSILSQGEIYKTTDAGINWELILSLSLPPGNYDLQFTSANNGWIMVGNATIGGQQKLYKTTNGGDNWEVVLLNNSDTTYLSMHFISDEIGWISTYPSYTLFHTTDSGISWQKLLIPDYFNSIFFIDSLSGWGGTVLGAIYHTNDGGKNWESQSCPYSGPVRNIFFNDEKNGWIIGSIGEILHTTNGGITFIDTHHLEGLPEKFILYQNYPNPFNSETIISFELPNATNSVSIYIYDILGRKIRTINIASPSIGNNSIYWDGKSEIGNPVGSGIYFYSVSVFGSELTKKMILLR